MRCAPPPRRGRARADPGVCVPCVACVTVKLGSRFLLYSVAVLYAYGIVPDTFVAYLPNQANVLSMIPVQFSILQYQKVLVFISTIFALIYSQ